MYIKEKQLTKKPFKTNFIHCKIVNMIITAGKFKGQKDL